MDPVEQTGKTGTTGETGVNEVSLYSIQLYYSGYSQSKKLASIMNQQSARKKFWGKTPNFTNAHTRPRELEGTNVRILQSSLAIANLAGQ